MSHSEINEGVLVEILELIEISSSIESLRDACIQTASLLGLANISHGVIGLPPSVNKDRAIVITTYSQEWHRFYFQNNYIDLDPIVRLTASPLTPVDWDDIPRSTLSIRDFFENAERFGVGSRGITIPLRGRFGETAIFSATSNCSEKQWKEFISKNLRYLRIVASQLHRRVLILLGVTEQVPLVLSHREATCLRLKALGKTDSEVATILGITKRTVSFHIESARSRLNAVNGVHAVAKALALGLISLASEPDV